MLLKTLAVLLWKSANPEFYCSGRCIISSDSYEPFEKETAICREIHLNSDKLVGDI